MQVRRLSLPGLADVLLHLAVSVINEIAANWHVELNAGNDPRWLEPYLGELLIRIANAKETSGYAIPTTITVSAPDQRDVICKRNR
jgi:hypothetical protein